MDVSLEVGQGILRGFWSAGGYREGPRCCNLCSRFAEALERILVEVGHCNTSG